MRRLKVIITALSILLLTGCASLHPAQQTANKPDNNSFYFVQITDTHFGDRDFTERTRKVVEAINKLPMEIKCVVHTGDITMNCIEDKEVVDGGLSVLQGLKVPIHYVPGNHDILPERLESTCKAYTDNFGPLISQQEYNGVIFLFVYTEPLRESFSVANYEPLGQLEEYLRQSKGKPVIICHHAPSIDDFYNNTMYEGWPKEARERWTRLINSYNVRAVIAGHFHKDEFHWQGDVPLYVSSSIAGYMGRQVTFRIYTYRDGRLEYRTQYIE